MRKIQDPGSRIQRRSNHQAANPRLPLKTPELESWIFSGSWMLEVGSFARACLLAAVVLSVTTFPAHAQTNTTSAGNRYLFIIETSRSMQHRSDGMLAAVQQLLNSGIGGQLMRGDTLGIWTYNQDLYSGRFPLQHWSPEMHRAIVSLVLSFLQGQKLEKQCSFVPVLPALEALVKNSPFLTVIVVSVGEQKILGTPFDDQINKLYGSWANEQQKARMPFLTILRAKAGKFTDFSVNAAPWPVEMPPLPKELFIAQAVEKKTSPPVTKPPPPPIGRNIIVSGKKTPAPESKATPPLITNAPNQVSEGQVPQPQTNSTEGTPAILSQSPAAINPVPAPDTSKAAPSPGPLLNRPPPEKSSSPLPAPEPHRESPGASASLITNEAVVATKAQDSASASPQNPPASPEAAVRLAVATTASSPPPAQKDAHQPVSPPAMADSARSPESESQKQTASIRPSSSVPVVAIAPKLFFDRTTTLVLAISSVVALLILVWIWLRRSRATRHVSLITRSLDHEKP